MTDPPLGIVGTGLVGMALARRLLARGRQVIGWDTSAQARAAFAGAGGEVAGDAAALARCAPAIFVAVLDDAQVAQVLSAIGPAIRPRHLIVDVHTGDPKAAEAFAAGLAAQGAHYVDAPVAGSSAAIGRGEGVAMAGGDPDSLAAALPLLRGLFARVVPLGPAGHGMRAKLAINLVIGLNRAALAEGIAFAERLDLPAPAFLDLVRGSAADSGAVAAKGRRMVERDYTPPESRITQHRKDVSLIEAAAARHGAYLPLTAAHRGLLDAAIAAGDGALDNAAVIEMLRRRPSSAERA